MSAASSGWRRRWWTTLARPFDLQGERLFISASAGVALYPPDAANVGDLLARADQAMYASKKAGRNRFSYFTPDLQEAARARQSIAADLRAAIAAQQFEIVYQPIICLATGTVRKAEALLRWRHPTRGLLGPAEFIPFAESNGLIVEIGDWVFREAARQVQLWQQTIHPAFQVSVNKSPVQFRRDAALYQAWLDYLAELGLPPQSIVIEIAESVLLEGADKVVERLRQYRAMGLQVVARALRHRLLVAVAPEALRYRLRQDRPVVRRHAGRRRRRAGAVRSDHRDGAQAGAEGGGGGRRDQPAARATGRCRLRLRAGLS